MMMIEKESDIMFVKDVAILDIKPQSPTAVTITKVVPPPVATPSTCSCTIPSSSTSQPTSGGSGLLKVLKSMF
jgi:hypothetical protein